MWTTSNKSFLRQAAAALSEQILNLQFHILSLQSLDQLVMTQQVGDIEHTHVQALLGGALPEVPALVVQYSDSELDLKGG